jgi:hypothetical protein
MPEGVQSDVVSTKGVLPAKLIAVAGVQPYALILIEGVQQMSNHRVGFSSQM